MRSAGDTINIGAVGKSPLQKIYESRKSKLTRQKLPLQCPYCKSQKIIRKGKRKNKLQTLQVYQCKELRCKKIFTTQLQPNLSYPIKNILRSLSLYNLGYSQKEVCRIMKSRYKTTIPQRTLSSWINKFRDITTFSRLRSQAIKLYRPEKMVASKKLYHTQVYAYKIHNAKLDLFCPDLNKYPELRVGVIKKEKNGVLKRELATAGKYAKLRFYLLKVLTNKFPHHIFREKPGFEYEKNKKGNKGKNHYRGSQINLEVLNVIKVQKKNYANLLAEFALELSRNNFERHEAIQDFMIKNDSTTIAVEIPVYLTKHDLWYFRKRKFNLDPFKYKTPITGHIDLLQIRNNVIHILDYKPQADNIKAIKQLTLYALALASRTQLPLRDFKCAWFDENNYYEFFPLHAVYKKKK